MKSGAGIVEIHFSTSYTQVVVQDEVVSESGCVSWPVHDLIIPIKNSNWVDLIATQDDDEGEFVTPSK